MATFQDALQRHLQAIQRKDLDALAATVARDQLVLISAQGKLSGSAVAFLDAHRSWFDMSGWGLQADVERLIEGADLGVAVLHLRYREDLPDRPPLRQESWLTLIFQRGTDGDWRLVFDQNTPMAAP